MQLYREMRILNSKSHNHIQFTKLIEFICLVAIVYYEIHFTYLVRPSRFISWINLHKKHSSKTLECQECQNTLTRQMPNNLKGHIKNSLILLMSTLHEVQLSM